MFSDFNLRLSIIIAVYNRKEELKELLNSLANQTDKDFEVIVVDDGSTDNLEVIALEYLDKLDIKYFYQKNTGAGYARNMGVSKSSRNYLIFLDSDCIAPKNYIYNVKKELKVNFVDAFGGADSASSDFNNLQKAISYSMTSYLTTGGIRGNKNAVSRFQPRSFNMGISKIAFNTIGGFSELRIGEDPDLSLCLWENNFETRFFPSCTVYHKRRTSLLKFAKQVYKFGIARPILNQRHPKFKKLTFWFPSIFLIYTIISILLLLFVLFYYIFNSKFSLFSILCLFPFIGLILYCVVLFVDSSNKNKSLKIGYLSLITTFTQFFSYGFGFLQSYFALNILKRKAEKSFPSHYY
ncbi:glycosyltransferase [Apibacter muscae]|uniref:glycosyltransferase n=1 Tax=Apibacter muscae TaxID=2509004 RepID=UPI0011ABDE8B|nr:glycosyltransferase [Apibacter muscae]TWP27624.1 glycosyltransferase [Apibacter muscae]